MPHTENSITTFELEILAQGGLDLDGNPITNVADPSTAQMAATKNYVDNSIGAGGGEVAFQDFTSPVSITATTEGSANTIVTAPAFTPNGTSAYLFEFYAPDANPDFATGTYLALYLFEDGSSIGMIWDFQSVSVGFSLTGVYAQPRFVPSASSHVYSVRGSVDAGTGTVSAGTGGVGTLMPGYIRITQAN